MCFSPLADLSQWLDIPVTVSTHRVFAHVHAYPCMHTPRCWHTNKHILSISWKRLKKTQKNCFFTLKLHRCLIISADLYVNSWVANKKRLWRTTHTVHIKRNPLHMKLRIWPTDLPSDTSSNPPPVQADSTVEIQLPSPDIITEKQNDFFVDFQSSGLIAGMKIMSSRVLWVQSNEDNVMFAPNLHQSSI